MYVISHFLPSFLPFFLFLSHLQPFSSLFGLAFNFAILTAKTDLGSITATLGSTRNATSCIPTQLKFGPISGSRLTVGPNHNPWYDPNQFFLELVGGNDTFIGSVQSGITSLESNVTWWSLQAWQNTTVWKVYEMEGTMLRGVDDSIGEQRNQISGVWEVAHDKIRMSDKISGTDDTTDDPCQEGKKYLWRKWHVKDNTTLKGQVSPEDAHMVVTGRLVLSLDPGNGNGTQEKRDTLERRLEAQDMSYTLTFSGTHYSGSAPLPTNGLVWNEAGSGPPLEPYQFPTLQLPTSSIITTTTTTRRPTTMVKPTQTPPADGPPNNNNHPPPKSTLPQGSIIGIIIGGVLAILVFMGILFFIKSQRAKNREPKVYPELAYIYSTPFTSMGKNNQAGSSRGGVEGPTGGSGASSYYGATPHLEVNLGDQAPFLGPLDSTEVAGRSPATMSGALIDGNEERDANRTRLEEQEEMERQPMLPGPLHYERQSSSPKEY